MLMQGHNNFQQQKQTEQDQRLQILLLQILKKVNKHKQRIMYAQINQFDRFIANTCYQSFSAYQCKKNESFYGAYIKENLCPASKILNYGNKQNQTNNVIGLKYQPKKKLQHSRKRQVHINDFQGKYKMGYKKLRTCSEAEKILDMPNIKDDFYLNNLDWSPLGPIGVCLDNQVYLYTPTNITELCRNFDGNYASSLKFYESTLSIGFSDGKIRIYDLETSCLIRQITEHQKRVSALDICQRSILYSGSKDKNILLNDLRIKDPAINRLTTHRGEICSLKIQPGTQNYLASGSNDNHVAIWDIRRNQLMKKYTSHKGAVKAIGWCPWKLGVIASAGGAGDKTIRVWSVHEDQDLALKKTDSQITSLIWNEQSGTLISSHGHPNNTISFWKPQLVINKALSLEKVGELKGHTGRILNLAMSPADNMICSVGSDETLRLWNFLDSEQDPWKCKQNQKSNRWSLKLK